MDVNFVFNFLAFGYGLILVILTLAWTGFKAKKYRDQWFWLFWVGFYIFSRDEFHIERRETKILYRLMRVYNDSDFLFCIYNIK